ncbi:3D domain-containing protein [Deinococcus irradiatisoli]|uniref:3D domain-containing protein n=1 Tax=Deinococcus irradiatisoli TaxID=2202254 RepID=UPI001FE90003|nr:3D domain-containing protein [Deinococcus irradiatisoli]
MFKQQYLVGLLALGLCGVGAAPASALTSEQIKAKDTLASPLPAAASPVPGVEQSLTQHLEKAAALLRSPSAPAPAAAPSVKAAPNPAAVTKTPLTKTLAAPAAPLSAASTPESLPQLPSAALIEQVVGAALAGAAPTVPVAQAAPKAPAAAKPAPKPAAPVAKTPAAKPVVRPVVKAPAPRPRAPVVQTSRTAAAVITTGRQNTGLSRVVKATAYSSDVAQTDSSPFITATGTRVRPGVIALSRDLLRLFPYGSRVTIQDSAGLLTGRVFIVEDTMNVRLANTIDIWMGSRAQAYQWGSRTVRITALR